MEAENVAKLTLVGAGPGSSDLITMRGFKALQEADVILYDALISKELLQQIDGSAPQIYVGKRCGKHEFNQDDINRLIVEKAYMYGHVVRLKGGDPFVFGRASEEIEYAESFGISTTVIPGVTSAIAVAGSQGIPVTQRGISSSFWVMTATKRDGSFSEDLKLAAQSSATLVILMGVRKLNNIIDEIRNYRNGLTPVAIIQNGTLENEICHTATLNTVSLITDKIDIRNPGIIVIGDVVANHPTFFAEEVQRVLCSHV